ncbi:MAG: PQQ-binding-like beta-propeller repeat protein [Halobacteriaceae archaeon]
MSRYAGGGPVHAVDAESGRVEWRAERVGGTYLALTSTGRRVYARYSEVLACLDGESGDIEWAVPLVPFPALSPPAVVDGTASAAADGVVAVR